MNIDQAKQIPIEDLLGRLGYKPSHNRRGQLWYLSPLRDEKTASFKVNPTLNAWYDFGEGKGGDIIDLVMRLERVNSISDALARLEAIVGAEPLPVRVPNAPLLADVLPALELTSIGPVTSQSLRRYLNNRGIGPADVANRVMEAHYRRGTNSYFALAFANDSSGYELRSPEFKGTLGSKDITTIRGNPDRVKIFEGFFDYLSALTRDAQASEATVIVLNSVAMHEKAASVIRSLNPTTVELYRDHDRAGEQLTERLQSALPDVKIVDRSDSYIGFNDLNAWHIASRSAEHSRLKDSIAR